MTAPRKTKAQKPAPRPRKSAARLLSSMAETRQKPVTRGVFVASTIATIACFAIVVWVVISQIAIAEFGIWPRMLIVLLLAVFITSSLATTEIVPWTSRSWSDWHQPKVLGTLIYMVLGAAAFVSGLASIFNAPAAEQATLLEAKAGIERLSASDSRILAGQDAIALAVRAGEQSLIRQNIAGRWGRPGCAVTYQFVLIDNAITVSSEKSPPGVEDYEPEYTVVADRDVIVPGGERTSVMEGTETKGFWPGFGVQFRYSANGVSETLIWDHKMIDTMPLKLVRC